MELSPCAAIPSHSEQPWKFGARPAPMITITRTRFVGVMGLHSVEIFGPTRIFVSAPSKVISETNAELTPNPYCRFLPLLPAALTNVP